MSKDNDRVPAELQAFLERHPGTQLLELLQPDMLGILRGKRVVANEFAKPFDKGVNFCGATVLLDSKGHTFDRIEEGSRNGDPDVISTAVPGSLAPVPWAQVPTAQVLLAMADANGQPHFADPRQVLRNAARPLQEMGLTAVTATELEFYLLNPAVANAGGANSGGAHSASHRPTPKVGRIPGTSRAQDGPQYATMDDVEDVDPFLAELYSVCAAQNIPAGATLKEFSPGQFEVNLHHVASAELACDHAVLLKRAVKAVAKRHGLAASFMAKPFAESAGCSLHVHVSLVDGSGRNVFAGPSADQPYSDLFRHAVGGLAATMRESMAIFAPTANSYRRYRPGLFVPLAPSWGLNHRGVALRVPLAPPQDTRIEHRPGGADGNPYLVMAAILAGLHHGITNRCDPGKMVMPGEVIEEKISLPLRWEAALDAFDAGTVLPHYLGERYHDLFATCRREECDRFHAEITDRDYEWYLRAM
ncbi:MAG TPA: glutamine synthetase family protein [Steroidobacteraceae bacterium]|nr:glutamine synthetase family protein [Steroidobacteraceae bacterium]